MRAKLNLLLVTALILLSLTPTAYAESTTVILGDFAGLTSRCTDASFGDLFMAHGTNAWQLGVGIRAGVVEWGGDELAMLNRRTGITLDSFDSRYKSELTLSYDQHWLNEVIVVFIDESDYNAPGFRGADITAVSSRVNPTTTISTTTLNDRLGGNSQAWGSLAYQIFRPQLLANTTHHTVRIAVPAGGRFRLLAVIVNSGRDLSETGRYSGPRSNVLPLNDIAVLEDPAWGYLENCAVRERGEYY